MTNSMHTERKILHVDMDAFYASIETRDNPALRGKPVIVGGAPQRRGVVSAASYEARKYGVHSAMPMVRALRLCPQAILIPPRMPVYAAVSQQIRDIFARYTPQFEPLSLDEAFLDVSACEKLFSGAETIARAIKQAIHAELALVASVGVAPNKFIAKIASDVNKPDGFVVVDTDQVQSFPCRSVVCGVRARPRWRCSSAWGYARLRNCADNPCPGYMHTSGVRVNIFGNWRTASTNAR